MINLRVSECEPAAADFADDEAFMASAAEAKARSLYDTGVEIAATDRLLTLITCDRSCDGADGQLAIMAAEQQSPKEIRMEPIDAMFFLCVFHEQNQRVQICLVVEEIYAGIYLLLTEICTLYLGVS